MTIEEIFNSSEFIGSLIGTETFGLKLKLRMNPFGDEIPVYINSIPSQELGSETFQKIERIVNAISILEVERVDEIEQELTRQYDWFCEQTEPITNENKLPNAIANKEYFAITNSKDLIVKTQLKEIECQFIRENSENDISICMNFTSEWIGDGFLQLELINDKVNSTVYH